jgi:hypothetical protein
MTLWAVKYDIEISFVNFLAVDASILIAKVLTPTSR